MHTRILQKHGISTQADIDYLIGSPNTPKNTVLEMANSRLPLTWKEEMMLLHPGDRCDDGDVDGGTEEATMPFHCGAKSERNMLPILEFLCPNNRTTRRKRSFVGIRHTLPSVALAARAYMPMVTVVVGLGRVP